MARAACHQPNGRPARPYRLTTGTLSLYSNLLSPYYSDELFWDYSLDEMVRYDLPSIINYVKNHSKAGRQSDLDGGSVRGARCQRQLMA